MGFDGINKSMIEGIRYAQVMRKDALEKCIRIEQDSYTDEYKARETARIINEVKAAKDQTKAKVAEEVTRKVSELDANDIKDIELRSLDLDYVQRLNAKLDTICSAIGMTAVGASYPDALSKEWVRAFLKEFTDDPISIGVIKSRLREYAVGVLPEDNTGRAQKRLLATQKVFNSVMDHAVNIMGENGLSKCQDVAPFTKEEEEAFIKYLSKQNDDFTVDDEWLYAKLVDDNPEFKNGVGSIEWKMQLALDSLKKQKQKQA